MTLVTDWRLALVSALRTAFPLATVKSGQRNGVNKDGQDLIHVMFAGYDEDGGQVVVANPRMFVRYWPTRAHAPDDSSPWDPAPLEDAAVSLATALRGVQTSLAVDGLWYFRTVSVETDEDPEEWGVQATLLGFATNVAVVAA